MIEFLQSPWANHFDDLIGQVRSSLVISSPYIGRMPCDKIIATKSENNRLSILLLTDLSRDNLLSGSTDISAICHLADTFQRIEIRFLPSMHAKVYVADDKLAIVTSANMTNRGLLCNYEYGVKVVDANLVRRIKLDITEYASLGTKIDRAKLKFFSEVSSDLNCIRAKAEKSIKSRLRSEFEQRLKNFDEEIIKTRVAGRAPHTIFSEAIIYLLSRKPMSTGEMHPLIQRIHPDLCDDSVDRVIDGKHFGKKWKHAVRTAQQHLKKTGQIELKEGVWYLKGS